MKESEEEKTNETENKREERDKLRGWHCLRSHAPSVPCRALPSVPFPFLANSMHCPPVFARPPSPRCARSIHFSLKLFSSPSCAPAHRKSLARIFQKNAAMGSRARRVWGPAEWSRPVHADQAPSLEGKRWASPRSLWHWRRLLEGMCVDLEMLHASNMPLLLYQRSSVTGGWLSAECLTELQ